jgi:putative transposase
MNRKIKFAQGEYYHIYSRGVEKRIIFQDEDDYKRFIFLLNLAKSEESINIRDLKKRNDNQGLTFVKNKGQTLVNIGAWCLMPNHFHLLISENSEGGISLFLQKLLTSYSMYFNKKYDRKGSLFESRFQAEHLDTDNYLKYIFSYIHLNPVKLIDPFWKIDGLKDFIKTRDFLKKYLYSSYTDYLDYDREEKEILNRNAFPDYFPNEESFEDNLSDWLKFNPNNLEISK